MKQKKRYKCIEGKKDTSAMKQKIYKCNEAKKDTCAMKQKKIQVQ